MVLLRARQTLGVMEDGEFTARGRPGVFDQGGLVHFRRGGGVLVAGAEAGRRCGIVHACCDMD